MYVCVCLSGCVKVAQTTSDPRVCGAIKESGLPAAAAAAVVSALSQCQHRAGVASCMCAGTHTHTRANKPVVMCTDHRDCSQL